MLLAAIAAVVVLGAWLASGQSAIRQPIEFPHKVHLELDRPKLECKSCHETVETARVAGRPSTEKCLSCHSGETDKAELKKLDAFADSKKEIPWTRIWHLPDDVIFSHRQHVAIAQMECRTCHGDFASLERPPARPLKTLSMAECIACHERWRWPADTPEVIASRPIAADCNACHR